MEKNLKRLVFGAIYCTVFILPFVLSCPAYSQSVDWVQLLGTASYEEGDGVAVDTSGNIYVTGATDGNLGGQTNAGQDDVFLAKYDGSGTRQWVQLLGTPSYDDGYGVAVDTSGNIYVTGATDGNLGSQTNAGNDDVFLAKYDSSGNMQWVKLLGSEWNDLGYGVAVDTSGNIYVTGVTNGDLGNQTNSGGTDLFLAKYDSSGAMQWVKQLGNASDVDGKGVAVDTSGNIYVTGYTDSNLGGQTNAGYDDVFLAKYDSSGNMQWVKLLGSAAKDYGYDVAVDTSGNIYVTGETAGNLGGKANAGMDDAFLASYDSSGNMQWVQLLGSADEDTGNGVTVDTSGNIYITGITYGKTLGGETNAGADDAFLASYDSSGTRQWVKLLGTSMDDGGDAVAADTSGNIYVTGYTGSNFGDQINAGMDDVFLAKFKAESFPWELFFPAFMKKK